MHPYLSIIIPCYNADKYIAECVNSILANTFDDFEVLLIDDGSKNPALLDSFAGQRVKVYHQKNSGVSSARNLGIENSSGQWITFIDADDFISPNFLENLIAPTLTNHILEFVHGGCTNFYEASGKRSIEQHYDNEINPTVSDLYFKSRGLIVSKLFRRNVIDAIGLTFDTEMKVGEDLVFTLTYLSHIKHGAFVSETGYYYRRTNISTTGCRRIDYPQKILEYKRQYNASQNAAIQMDITNWGGRKRLLARDLVNLTYDLYRQDYKRAERLKHLSNDTTPTQKSDIDCSIFGITVKPFAWLLKHNLLQTFDMLASLLFMLKK